MVTARGRISRQLHRRRFLGLKSLFPFLASLVLVTISATNLQIEGFSYVVPQFSVMGIFFWAVFMPRMMPKWMVFLLGVFQDGVLGLPLGSSSLIMILFWAVIRSQRVHIINQPFWLLWFLFSVSLLFYAFVNWIELSLFFMQPLRLEPALMQVVLTIVFYPAVHKLHSTIFSVLKSY